jgi:hypothetical protein
MADAVEHMNRIQDRLRPFTDQLNQVMRDDPNFQGEVRIPDVVLRRLLKKKLP